MTIRIAAILNPFDPLTSREVEDVPAGRPIRELIAEFSVKDGYDIEVSVDGARLDSQDKMELIPKDGSSVVFVAVPQGGGGKNPLALVATLALLAVAPAIGAGLVGAMGFVSFPALQLGLTAGVLIAGGTLISSVFRPSLPDSRGPADSSPTYSWDVTNNAVSEGTVLPELFGTHRVTPPIIGHYVRTDGDKQFLNLLFAVAGHPLDSISDVRINDTDIGDMTGIETPEKRFGYVAQGVVQNFNDTRADTLVGAKLEEPGTWTTRTTTGNDVTGLTITFSCPKGLFYADNDGSLKPVALKIYAEYSIHGADSWTRLTERNKVVEAVTTGRWSAGYYNPETSDWIELESGTSDPEAHDENDPYYSTIWVGGYGEDPESSGGYQYQRVGFWRWAENTTIVKIDTVLNDYVTISDNKSSPIHRAYPTGRLTAGQYDIRCSIVEEPLISSGGVFYGWGNQSTERLAADVYFESFQEAVADDFTYPGISLLGISALATDQLSGSIPRVDVLATRSTVPVWTGAAYAQKPASNPAWAAYHLLHQARHNGTGDAYLASSYDVLGVPASRIVYSDFLSWSGWCDNPAGDGSLAPHTCNVYFDTSASLRKSLDIVGACGRGVVTQIGSRFTVIVDRPEQTPVQRFLMTPGNIVAGSFSEEFLPMGDRANSVEVTYFDAAQDYSRQVVEVYATDFDTTDREINKASVTLLGVTSRQKAIDYARFLLNSNRYLVNTVSVEADVDSIACIPGDVIEISHDVPQWGYGGRVVSATATGVTLDRSVTLEAATTYRIMVKHQDDDSREYRNFSVAGGTYTTLVIPAWTKIPEPHALYSIGEVGSVVKEFRVLKIGTGQDLRRKLTCIEYLQEVFEDGATIPEPENPSDLSMVANLTATEVYRGGQDTRVYLKWTGVALFWNVYKRVSGGTWAEVRQAYNPSCEIAGLDYGISYEFAVTPSENPGDGETVSITLRGKIDPPGDVPSITASDEVFYALVEWDAVTDFDLWGYELRVISGSTEDWSASAMLFKGNARSYIWKFQTAGAYTLQVRAVDAFGNYSDNSATVLVTVGYPHQAVGAYSFSGPNAVLSWNTPSSAFAIDYYVLVYGESYETATAVGTTKGTTFSVNVTWGGMRRYWVAAVDVAGNEGPAESIDVTVVSPGMVGSLTPRIIDNNVLLQWSAPASGSLPIAYYEVSKGDDYAASVSVGTVQGTFCAIIEQASGSYTYWVRGIDTAGNAGTPVGIPATVSQPPDYVILETWTDDFSGTKVNALSFEGKLYAPVNITETYEEHFTVNGNNSPQDQIDAGHPLWIQPVTSTGSYQRTFDYGAVIVPMTKVTLDVTSAAEYGSVSITPSIEVSEDGAAWGAPVEAYSTTASGFRYVRVTLSFSGDGDSIVSISSLLLKLDLKQLTDSGRYTVTGVPSGECIDATDGCLITHQVSFNVAFLDVQSIVLTPQGTAQLTAVYDFNDDPNPTHFHIYLFDAAGVAATGDVSWTARGV